MVSNKHTHTAINTNTNKNTNSHKRPPENTTSKSQKAQAHSHGHQHKHNCHLKSTNDYQNHQICHLQSPTNLTENSLSLSSLSDSINLDLFSHSDYHHCNPKNHTTSTQTTTSCQLTPKQKIGLLLYEKLLLGQDTPLNLSRKEPSCCPFLNQ